VVRQDGRVARRNQGRPGGRFAKSGHTSHAPHVPPHTAAPVPPRVPPTGPGYVPGYGPPPGSPPPPADNGFGRPTYHGGSDDDRPRSRSAALTRAALSNTNRAARVVTKKVIRASKADGAHEAGLTALIWNQVLSYGTDAMITVALAGTVFFGASTNAQRGNVLLYLLITMAPFAVVAPVIGPVLDRFQHGRRWTMAATAIGRGILALIMADHSSELLVLYPCALGSLVLSKAYGVLRAAAAPRLVPRDMTLTEANARLSIFGLGSTLVLGGFVGVVIKVTGSYSLGLVLSAIGFGACAFFAFRLPPQVDSSVTAEPHPGEAHRPALQRQVPPLERLRSWARRGYDAHLVTALQGESALRLLSGMLTIYLAFYVEGTAHGFKAAIELGAIVAAAGAGNFIGTAIGTKVKLQRPERAIAVSTVVAAVTCFVVALVFDSAFAVAGMLIAAVANALSKIALDALIQRDVPETLRSSAFARSETFLQLAWVIGAAIGVVLPSSSTGDGPIGFWVATALVGAAAVVVTLRQRALAQEASRRAWADAPGNLGPHPPEPS
jgi:hypothetical protein